MFYIYISIYTYIYIYISIKYINIFKVIINFRTVNRRRRNTLDFFPLRRFYSLAFFAPLQPDTLPLFSIPASRPNSFLPPPTFEN